MEDAKGQPFFWLGDTAWLTFQHLTQEEIIVYLDDRKKKGFNVVQMMVLHDPKNRSPYGAPALENGDPAHPRTTPGADVRVSGEYDYWDHVDWTLDELAKRGMYAGLVLCWGSLVKSETLNSSNVETYTRFLAERYRGRPNVIWITGGDIRGDVHPEVWQTMGATLKRLDPRHLVTYHPFGRTDSSQWFHAEPWLDFNMFQSGHRRYDQDASPGSKGEDNWRYVEEDWQRSPKKPALDGEPSYENLPQGLHDPKEPRWNANDVRRYAWWAVLAGAFGHTYGENAVIQMHKPDLPGSYGVQTDWRTGMLAPGSTQMIHVKRLILSRPFFERRPAPELIAGKPGERYEHLVASRGAGYAFVYTYTGRPFTVQLGQLSGRYLHAWWYNPRTGEAQTAGELANRGLHTFAAPGTPRDGNDWVLVLDNRDLRFPAPGSQIFAVPSRAGTHTGK